MHLTFTSDYHGRDGMFHEVTGLVTCTALLLPVLSVSSKLQGVVDLLTWFQSLTEAFALVLSLTDLVP